ncbi:MAG: 4-phosphoerythronate dehydrogenase [Pseudoflavonifractor sp.]|nr:4-phosphoerythronate dehydrogenase [Alloprevotella sp.]MCM1116989.1 4-phosphoerythronate dehydrogenase [Pseudoflavonifractor sp.]
MATDLKPRVIIESHIPFVNPALDEMASVTRLAPEEFTPEAVAKADALVVRTRTHAGAELLAGSRVKFVATATIGTDHIDLQWCRSRGITVANAPGCNAPGVAQYVLASIMSLGYHPSPDITLGIVGVGHVGKVVERWARALGYRLLLCDPPRALAEGPAPFATMEQIAREADVITLHTPLSTSGPYPTRHLISSGFLDQCRRKPLIVNAARGPVTDTVALCSAIDSGIIPPPVIDCWEGEPVISGRLLSRAAIATPHIAGYSLEGKMRATQMALDALVSFFGLEPLPSMGHDLSAAPAPTAASIAASYSPEADSTRLKASPASFEALRNSYAYRPEPR